MRRDVSTTRKVVLGPSMGMWCGAAMIRLADSWLPVRRVRSRTAAIRTSGSDMVVQGASTTDRSALGVGFVDVIGYTSLSARVDPADLRDILERFEARCTDVASESPDVELVKVLGDAAMYVSTDPEPLASLLLDLVDPVPHDDEDDLTLSGGMAFGPVLTRGGDVFGTPVNLAARLTDLAVGGSLVADDELGDRFADRFAISRLPPRNLHGIGRRRAIRVRRAN